jgi:hypothetical protein
VVLNISQLKKIYSSVVNVNQWFNYGKIWLNLPFTLLNITSSISIIFIYLGFEQSAVTLVLFNFTIFAVSLILGYILFRSKAQMVDNMMGVWRSPFIALSTVSVGIIHTELATKLDLPFPSELKEWGMRDWSDLAKLYKYNLTQGKHAQAMSICRDFFNTDQS